MRNLGLGGELPLQGSPGLDHYPTVLLHERSLQRWGQPGYYTAWQIQWSAMVWPAQLDPHWLVGVQRGTCRPPAGSPTTASWSPSWTPTSS